ncbi:alpha/beta fold hydrolase [Micromonospora echinofusca]|uniref:alpha/beta fold hydrolase n=1 Tax=Micromonospora echinofusca TaxID=47858 RepID=UPI0027DB5BEB|nr:alpha/beta hydrolase [Micromonospora echinofusca]
MLFCPGAATSRWLGFGGDVVDGLGIRLVSVDRPGLGASTPVPGRSLTDFAADMRAFCALRGLGRPAMVGNSQGAPFALACTVAGTASTLALVSAADEVALPEFAPMLPAELRDLVELTGRDPAGAEAVFRRFDAEAMWGLVMGASPDCDRTVYQDPVFSAAYRRALAEAFAAGPEGYARDTVLAMGRWRLDLAAIDVPVEVWYGSRDTGHSPDQGELLTTRIPGAQRHVVPEAGGALLWTHAGPILRRLVRQAGVPAQG